MRIKEGQIFNLMDTNGRRNDVINALQGYLTILDDIQNEQKMNWASMPESLAQYEFYRQAIELSPEVFGKHGPYDKLAETLERNKDFATAVQTQDMEWIQKNSFMFQSLVKQFDLGIEDRARHYTSNLVKLGFTDEGREISPVGELLLDLKKLRKDDLETMLPIDGVNIVYLRQLFEYAEYHTDKKMHLKKREDGSVREYVVTPYQMAAQEGKYYLICNYDKYDDISNYRVDRIRNIQILEEKGKPFETLKWSGHQPMNLNEYMKEHVYMYSSENAFVKFRIVKAMISDVIDLFGKGVKFSEETDTHVSVSVHVNERAAEQFAKNYAPDVVILQPKRLRDKLRDDLKKAWEAYED